LGLLFPSLTKPLDSSRSLRVLRLHRPERTKLLRKVQVQNACQPSWGLNCYNLREPPRSSCTEAYFAHDGLPSRNGLTGSSRTAESPMSS
jgi:hypothetical protein